MCDSKLQVAMCGSKLRCARATHFFETCDVRACGTFLDLRCAITTLHILNKKMSFFGVNYNSIPQKLRILAIKAIFDPKNPFLTDSIDDSIKISS